MTSKNQKLRAKTVELDPKYVAHYKIGDKVKVYFEDTPYAERKEYVVQSIDHVNGKLYLWELIKDVGEPRCQS